MIKTNLDEIEKEIIKKTNYKDLSIENVLNRIFRKMLKELGYEARIKYIKRWEIHNLVNIN